MKLAELQALFKHAMVSGDTSAMTGLIKPSAHGADETTLLSVYSTGYRARCLGILAGAYEALESNLGHDDFAALVWAFVDATPPEEHTRTAALLAFMEHAEPWCRNERALSLARFECALDEALDAEHASPVAIEALAAFASEDRPRLTFRFHPSVRLLDLSAGTTAAWAAAIKPEDSGDAVAPEGRERVIVWHYRGEALYRTVDSDEGLALERALAGGLLAEICEAEDAEDSGTLAVEHLAHWLSAWFGRGLIAGVDLGDND